jgi:hypothetical protein
MAELSCPICYPLVLNACDETLVIPIGVEPSGGTVYYRITDKFGNTYTGSGSLDGDLNLQLPLSDFPAGLFGPYSGAFKFEVLSFGDAPAHPVCSVGEVTICEQPYSCITITFVGNTEIAPAPSPYY